MRLFILILLVSVKVFAAGIFSTGQFAVTNADNSFSVSQTFSSGITLNGGQITFPATQVPSSNANTLDDYEEGTWTPSPTNITVVGSPTYTGTYTAIGRLVFFTLNITSTTSTAAASNGSSSFSGLPFTAAVYAACSAYSVAVGSIGNGTVQGGSSVVIMGGWAASSRVEVTGSYYR
jgi:hypothetical protein